MRAIMEKHFISSIALDILLRDPFKPDDYEEFIQERQRSIHNAIEDLLVKERLDLTLNLRELDSQIEHTEIQIRKNIIKTLGNDLALIPSHISQKANDLIQKAIKKNAALDADRLSTLEGLLEYTDLSGLKDTITNKSLWLKFQEKYGNKETFVKKYEQLADLRNSIAHNRTVDTVTEKEGEAALIWFAAILGKE